MGEELYRKGAKSFAIEYVGTALMVALQFLTAVLLIRSLSLQEYGVYSVLIATYSTLIMVSFFMVSPIPRYLPEFYERKNYFLVKRIVNISILSRLVYAVIIMAILLAFPGIFNIFGEGFEASVVRLFTLVILVGLVNEVFTAVLVAFIEQKTINIARLSHYFLFLVIAYLTLKAGYGLLGVVVAILVGGTTALLINFLKSYSIVFRLPNIGEPMRVFRRVLRYTAFQYFAKLGDVILNLTFDIYLVSYFLGTQAAALYAFGAKIPSYFMSYGPPTVGYIVFFPILVRKYTETNSKEQLSYFFRMYTRFTAFFVFPIATGLIILSAHVITYVFDPKYLPAKNVFIISAIGFAIWSFGTVLLTLYNTIEKPEIGFYSKVFIVYNLVASIIMIPRYGIIGAIIPTTTAMMFILAFEFVMTRRYIELSFPWKSLGQILLNTLAVILPLFYLSQFINSLTTLVMVCIFASLIYLGISSINRPFSERDRGLFNRIGRLGHLMNRF